MSQSAFTVVRGRGGGGLGQVDAAVARVARDEVESELEGRGYGVEPHVVAPPVVVHEKPALTKAMAISVACDEAIEALRLPRTTYHPYQCPSRPCQMSQANWDSLVTWVVTVANGYLDGTYGLKPWAQTLLSKGQLRGIMGFGGLGALGGWLQENPWVVQSVGDTITNWGEYLTSQQVKEAIEATAPKGALTKDDIPALLAMLQEGGYIPPGKTGEVEKGATEAAAGAMPGWMIPAILAGGAVLLLLVMKK